MYYMHSIGSIGVHTLWVNMGHYGPLLTTMGHHSVVSAAGHEGLYEGPYEGLDEGPYEGLYEGLYEGPYEGLYEPHVFAAHEGLDEGLDEGPYEPLVCVVSAAGQRGGGARLLPGTLVVHPSLPYPGALRGLTRLRLDHNFVIVRV